MIPSNPTRAIFLASGRLQEGFELGTRQDGLSLLERLDLLIASSLADLEVLEHKVAAGVQLSLVVCKLFQLQHNSFLVFLGLNEISFCLCLALRLVDNVLGFLLDGVVGVLDKVFIGLLGILFRTDHFGLHCLGIVDDLLDHTHDSTGSSILLVGLEAWRWRWAGWLLDLDKGGLLGVEALEDVEGCSQELLGRTLISNGCLELFVL